MPHHLARFLFLIIVGAVFSTAAQCADSNDLIVFASARF
jgi:hypothetical protein